MSASENKNRICIEGEACDKFHAHVGDMLETVESLRTAITTFPDYHTTSPGSMNPVLTTKMFADVIAKQLDQLYCVATGLDLEPEKEGGES